MSTQEQSRYKVKRDRAARGVYSRNSPFYWPPELADSVPGPSDGLDELVRAGLCTEEMRDSIRASMSRHEHSVWVKTGALPYRGRQ